MTISPYLRLTTKRDDGTSPVYIRLTKDRKYRYVTTGVWVKPNDWNPRLKEVRRSHRQYKRLNQIIRDKVSEIEETYHNDPASRASSEELKTKLTENESDKLLASFRTYIEEIRQDERYFELKRAKNTLVDLEGFMESKRLSIRVEELTPEFLAGFQRYLSQSVGNSHNTVARKMRVLKAFVKTLRMRGELGHNPFELVRSVSERPGEKAKLTPEQIDRVLALSLEPESSLWHTRNYFMFSFYNAGIRFGDLCCLRWRNLVDGRLIYTMNKTSTQKSILQAEHHTAILDLYRPATPSPEAYIFPLLKQQHDNPMSLRAEISSRNVVVNRNLKKLAAMAGIEANLSFHVSRHSFSQYALHMGLDIYTISKMLGHSDIKTTQAYLSQFDEELVDKSMQRLFGQPEASS